MSAKAESKPQLAPTISNLNSIERSFEKAREIMKKNGYKKLTKADLKDV